MLLGGARVADATQQPANGDSHRNTKETYGASC